MKTRSLVALVGLVVAFLAARFLLTDPALVTPCNLEHLQQFGVQTFDRKLWREFGKPSRAMLYEVVSRSLSEQWSSARIEEVLGPENDYVDDAVRAYRIAGETREETVLVLRPSDLGGIQARILPRVPGWSLRSSLWPGRCLW